MLKNQVCKLWACIFGAGDLKARVDALEAFVKPPLIFAPLTNQNVNVNGPLAFGPASRNDAGWSHAAGGNSFAFTGSPDRVRVTVHAKQAVANAANVQRPAPILELRRGGVLVASSATGYIRDATDHEESSNLTHFVDPTPGVNPVYTVTARRDSTQVGAVTSSLGYFEAEAVG